MNLRSPPQWIPEVTEGRWLDATGKLPLRKLRVPPPAPHASVRGAHSVNTQLRVTWEYPPSEPELRLRLDELPPEHPACDYHAPEVPFSFQLSAGFHRLVSSDGELCSPLPGSGQPGKAAV